MGAIIHTGKNHLPSPAPCFGEELLPHLLLFCVEMLKSYRKFSSLPLLQVSINISGLCFLPGLELWIAALQMTGAELWVCLAELLTGICVPGTQGPWQGSEHPCSPLAADDTAWLQLEPSGTQEGGSRWNWLPSKCSLALCEGLESHNHRVGEDL